MTTVELSLSRLMWLHYEPVHAVTYFHPRAQAAYEAAGLRGYWRGYFAGRAAPLGPVAAAPVIGVFYGFAPQVVARALPAVWELISPEQALRARLTGAVQALAELAQDRTEAELTEAADLLEAAVDLLVPGGHVLGAANAALPRNDQPLARIWQATTTLREHRGDGHFAALVAADLDPVETAVFRGAGNPAASSMPGRVWGEEQWQAAVDRLTERGWLDSGGKPTTYGTEAFQAVEDATDRAAERPWRTLGADACQRVRALLLPVARACHTVIPPGNPIGLPTLPD